MRAFNMLLLCAESGSVIDMLSHAQVRPLSVGTKVLDTPHGVTKVLLAPFGCRLKVFLLLGCTSRGCHYMPADSFAPRGAELWSLASSTTTTISWNDRGILNPAHLGLRIPSGTHTKTMETHYFQ